MRFDQAFLGFDLMFTLGPLVGLTTNGLPLGYVNTLGTTCVSPIYYEVAPTNGKACLSGWMNIGAGYCKKKKLGIF